MSLQKHAIFGDPTEIMLAISGKHHLPELLPLAVRLLAPDEQVALARIWPPRSRMRERSMSSSCSPSPEGVAPDLKDLPYPFLRMEVFKTKLSQLLNVTNGSVHHRSRRDSMMCKRGD